MIQKQKKPAGTIVLYIAALVVALIAVASLTTTIITFRSVVSQYVAQGYPAADVLKQLVPSQLLPGIFEPVALYGGVAALLFAAGMINQKVSKSLELLTKAEVCDEVGQEIISENDTEASDDGIESTEAIGEDSEVEENNI